MKILAEYINARLTENKLLSEKPIGEIYVKVFGEAAVKKCTTQHFTSARAGRRSTCIIRAWFGDDDDEKLNNVKKFLTDGLEIDLDTVDINIGFYPVVASGTYTACQIHALTDIKKDIKVSTGVVHYEIDKGSDTYIVCTGGTVTKKQLTPTALGLGGKVFEDVESIINALENSDKLNDNTTIKAFAISSIKRITHSISGKKYKSVQELSEQGNFSRDLSELNFAGIDSKSFNNVLNDFGEIMGSVFIMSKLEGKHNVYFPSASNSAMYDYVIDFKSSVNQVNISAKANGGAAPSASIPALATLELVDSSNGQLDFLDNKFLKHVLPILARKYNGVKLGIWQANIALLKVIADVFKDKQAIDILKVLDDYDVIIDDKTFSFDLSSIEQLKESDKLVEFLTKINALCGYGKNSNSSFFSPEKVLSALDGNNSKAVMIGCISQPFQRYAVDYLNKNYSDQITEFGKLSFGGYQIYLQKRRENQLTIKLINMQEGQKYKLSVTGSINNPNTKNTAIEVIKH